MKVLLPVSQFRITYEVASGRPYSRFEALILSAIRGGASSVADLRAVFAVHPRLLIDALVTLTQAGWLAIGGEVTGTFVLTAEGEKAVSESARPSTLVVATRTARLILERISGGVASNNEAVFVTSKKLRDKRNEWVELKMEVKENTLDEGVVYPLLPREGAEWIRWIGPIDQMTKDSTWLPLGVDLAKGLVIGLPEPWAARLRPIVLEECERRAPKVSAAVLSGSWAIPDRQPAGGLGDDGRPPRKFGQVSWPATVGDDDWLMSESEHVSYLQNCLQGARESVFIASGFLSADAALRLQPQILEAAARGVAVDVLWGFGASREAIEILKRTAYEIKKGKLLGRLQFNSEPSYSHARFVMIDTTEAVVGSFDWMASNPVEDHPALSIRLRGTEVLSALAHCAASLWIETGEGRLTSTPDKWRRVASEIERDAAIRATELPGSVDGTPSMCLILDRDHIVVLREGFRTAQVRLLVGSQQLGDSPSNLGTLKSEARSTLYRFVYGRELDGTVDASTRFAKFAPNLGGRLIHRPGFGANVVACDDWVCVSSCDFLSSQPFGVGVRSREVGILIEGADAVKPVWDRFAPDLPDLLQV